MQTMGDSSVLNNIACNVSAVQRWLKKSERGDQCIYHIGELSRDRLLDRDLDNRAAILQCCAEVGGVGLSQRRLGSGAIGSVAYFATRLGSLPWLVVRRELSPVGFWVLSAIDRGESNLSVVRRLSSVLGLPQPIVSAGLDEIRRLGLIELGRVQGGTKPHRGWCRTQRGRRVLRPPAGRNRCSD